MQSFDRFSKFAAEIRLKIYTTSYVPRLVTLGYDNFAYHPTAASSCTAILAVNQESRAEAQKSHSFGGERDQLTFNQLLPLSNLEQITIVITAFPNEPSGESTKQLLSREESILLNYANVDDRIGLSNRRERREHIEWMKAEAREELAELAKENPEWKIPQIDFKLLMKGGQILQDLDNYFEDNGDTYPEYLLEDDYFTDWDGRMVEEGESTNGNQSEEPRENWRTWDGVLKEDGKPAE